MRARGFSTALRRAGTIPLFSDAPRPRRYGDTIRNIGPIVMRSAVMR